MTNSADFRIAVFPGDGIGDEITQPTLRLIAKAAARTGGFTITPQHCPAGAAHYRDQGTALPKPSIDTARQADAILLAAMGLPSVRYDDGTEISPQLDLRFELGLYAGVRPIRAIPGVPVLLADPRTRDMDFVILRESTEGLFASHGKGDITPDRATETMVLTRHTSERLHDFRAFAWFRDIFDQRAKAFPGLTADHMYVDACALMMVQRPWTLDVLITENMFGDILSDLGAGLIGGMGYAPSADIGDEHALFQPCHGSAPDIAGKGLANPTAMILSGAMMLEWLGREKQVTEATRAGALIRHAVDAAFAEGGLKTCELGGDAGTSTVFSAVEAAMDEADA
jgi:3-isopropylmalate dehydrogenase